MNIDETSNNPTLKEVTGENIHVSKNKSVFAWSKIKKSGLIIIGLIICALIYLKITKKSTHSETEKINSTPLIEIDTSKFNVVILPFKILGGAQDISYSEAVKHRINFLSTELKIKNFNTRVWYEFSDYPDRNEALELVNNLKADVLIWGSIEKRNNKEFVTFRSATSDQHKSFEYTQSLRTSSIVNSLLEIENGVHLEGFEGNILWCLALEENKVKNYKSSLKHLINISPKMATRDVLMKIGECCNNLGLLEDSISIDEFTAAIDIPILSKGYLIRSNCHWMNKDLALALSDLDKAIELTEKQCTYKPFLDRASINCEIGNFEKAKKDYKTISNMEHDTLEVLLKKIATFYLPQHDFHSATKVMNIVEDKYGNDPFSQRQIGLTYYVWCRFEKAIDCFRQYLKIVKNDGYVHFLLGDSYRVTENYDQALNHYQKSLSAGFDELDEVHYKIALVFFYKEQHDDFVEQAKKFINLEEHHHGSLRIREIYSMLGETSIALTNYEEAIEYCSRSIELGDSSIYNFGNRVFAYNRGDRSQLGKLFDKYDMLLDIDYCLSKDSLPQLFYEKSILLAQSFNEMEKAEQIINKSVVVNSKNADAYFYRALFYNQTKEREYEARDFKMAIKLDPEKFGYLEDSLSHESTYVK